jgi:hypothetical protein
LSTTGEQASALNDTMHKLLLGTGAGAGAFLAYLAARLLLAEPRLALTIVGQWGPMLVVLMVGLWFANARVGEWIAVMRENTQAQQQMADALRLIAEKDDRAVERQHTMMNYVGQQLERILVKLDNLGPGKCGVMVKPEDCSGESRPPHPNQNQG